ncbi:hypothetical protein ACFWVC_03475 [Streptomyces sp. NPDC058691]|uniref:hypothetical protein n=1 Tax=Streptomyces sp. NPDC058691 TaxID=3346601 RepID=UPI00365D791A
MSALEVPLEPVVRVLLGAECLDLHESRGLDWDDPDEEYEAPSEPWTVGGVLAGFGCLAAALAFVAIRVNGLVALFD